MPVAPLFSTSILPVLGLRFIGYLPYFKIGSALLLPQPLGLAAAAATTLAFSVACLAVSRWLSHREMEGGKRFHGILTPLFGAAFVLVLMMLAGPAIFLLLPSGPETAEAPLALLGQSSSYASLIPGFAGLLLPVSAGFLAMQLVTRASARRRT